jgi:hypothetical protein
MVTPARGKALPGRLPTRQQYQRDAEHMLPLLLGMVVELIIDDEARAVQYGKLCRRTDGAWQVNDRVFTVAEIDAFQCAWIYRECHETATTIVVDEALPVSALEGGPN